MTERVQRMLKSLKISKYPLCIEYFKLANESLDQTAGEPMLLRRAKLHAHVLDHMPIFIEPEDLLCGVLSEDGIDHVLDDNLQLFAQAKRIDEVIKGQSKS